MTSTPLLWICGAPGVGKSAAAWAVLSRLKSDAVRTGYVDIDQLGMCLPGADDDPERTRLKARNLGAVLAIFRQAGAERLIVSGVATAEDVPIFSAATDGAEISWVLLDLEQGMLRTRLETMAWSPGAIEEAIQYAEEVAASSFAELTLDVTGLSIAEVAELLLAVPPGAGHRSNSNASQEGPIPGEPRPVLWVTGPRAIGKSTVGWEILQRPVQAGVRTLFLDLRQLGFLVPAPDGDPENHAIRAANLGAIVASSDARAVVTNGPIESEADLEVYASHLPPATPLTLVRLRSGGDTLRERMGARVSGVGWRETGDDLLAIAKADLDRRWQEAVSQAERMDRESLGDLVVDTDGRGPAEIAEEVLRGLLWWSEFTEPRRPPQQRLGGRTAVDIRAARNEDLDVFIDVRLRALGTDPFAFGSTVAQERARPRADWRSTLARIQEHGVLMLALNGQRAVGMARGERWEGLSGVAGLFGMWVDPAYRGAGIGRQLVDGVLAWARAAAFGRVELDVAIGNTAAIALYASSGFRDTGERRPMSRDPSIIEQRMRLDLAL
jgi:ribosomal protein S18 acetylase RimI-like enzyme/adenylylsulfate kinase-like enzyme